MVESGWAKKHVFCSDGTVAGTGCKTLACAMAKSWYTGAWCKFALQLTARQYGEVVLPDDSIRVESWYPAPAGPVNCHGARRVWRTFCRPGTNFIEHYECRSARLIGAENLSPVTKLVAGTGAVAV